MIWFSINEMRSKLIAEIVHTPVTWFIHFHQFKIQRSLFVTSRINNRHCEQMFIIKFTCVDITNMYSIILRCTGVYWFVSDNFLEQWGLKLRIRYKQNTQ